MFCPSGAADEAAIGTTWTGALLDQFVRHTRHRPLELPSIFHEMTASLAGGALLGARDIARHLLRLDATQRPRMACLEPHWRHNLP